ncbi:MAG: fused MFS/spermidine synthase [Planctomycetota bacterium]|nr:fused MFS/spermidine synthase [Planctomycetota bacterium]
MSWPVMVFMITFSQFFLPALLLGTFGPVAARMALCHMSSVGATMGSMSAWGTAGALVGTLAPGFWLISACGAKGLLTGVIFLLAVSGLVFGPGRVVHVLWVLAMAAGVFFASGGMGDVAYPCRLVFQESSNDVIAADSRYQFIRVYDDDSPEGTGRRVRVLMLDNLFHGYVDLQSPGRLEYGYERMYRDVACKFHGGRGQVSAFFIGGGSYSFPRWVLNQWPGSNVVVAEIDPMVVEAAHSALGLAADTPIRTLVMDARNATDGLSASEHFDFVFGDAFNDFSIPSHLTTVEFAWQIKDHLTTNGAYLVNVVDEYRSGLMVASLTSTLRQVFKHVYVFCTGVKGVKNKRDTFVIAASDTSRDMSLWLPGHTTAFCGSLLTEDNLKELDRKCGGRVLTDDDAPVENLMAPVLRTSSDY